MKSSINALICSVFILFAFYTNAQTNTKKYIKRNRNAPVTTYGDSSIYCRGIYQDSSILFLGNSDGSIYRYDADLDSSKLVMKFQSVTEIRDLEFSNGIIYGMQSGEDGKLVKIDETGPTGTMELAEWQGVFFDAMDFNGDVGFIMGDPVDGKMSLFHTKDGGKNWSRCEGTVNAFKGEAGFAASGSNVEVVNDHTYIFITGGMRSNFYRTTDSGKTWSKVELPYYPGETIGAYSMCFKDETYGVIVGGDYTQPHLKMNTTYYTYDGGETWMNSIYPPGGYRSCVYQVNDIFYACGRNGIDFSKDNGKTWTPFAEGAFFSMTSVNGKLIATCRYGQFKSFDLIQ